MTEKVVVAFDTPDEARAAAERLKIEGFPREAITLMSAEPIHADQGESSEDGKSRMGLFAIAGGFFGAISALLLTVITSQQVNLVTGGMPIVAWWAFGIIVFELTALGAILGTLGRMIYESGLARRGAMDGYDKSVADGKIVLAVECVDDSAHNAAERLLSPQ